MNSQPKNYSPRSYNNLSYHITESLSFIFKKCVVSPMGRMGSPLVGVVEKKIKHNLEKSLSRNDFCFALLKKLYEWGCVTEVDFGYYAEVRKHHPGTEKIKTQTKLLMGKVLRKKTESVHAGSAVDDGFDISTKSYFFKGSTYVIAVAIWLSHTCYKTYSNLKNGQAISSDESSSSSDKIYFAKILLRKAKPIVNSSDWDKEGKDLFFRPIKCPNGFQRIRKCLTDIDSILDKSELAELINKINEIRDLVTKKSNESNLYKSHWYRSLRTQKAYEMLSNLYETYSKCTFEPQDDWAKIKAEDENVLIFTDNLYSDDWESLLYTRKESAELIEAGTVSEFYHPEYSGEEPMLENHLGSSSVMLLEYSLIGKTYSFFKSNADSLSSALSDFSREIKDVARICVSQNLIFPMNYGY